MASVQSVAAHPSGAETAVRAPSSQSAWIVGPRFDTVAVLGGAALVSLALYTSARSGAALALAGALFAMITDMPHVMQTTVRIGLDPRERRLHGRRYLVSLAVIAAFTLAMFMSGNRPVVAMVWIVWQFLHVVKQHYGISRIYAAKAGYRGPFRWMTGLLWLGCASPVVYRIGQGMRFNEYVLFGQRMPFSGLGLPDIPVPSGLVVALYAGALAMGVLFIREQVVRWRRKESTLPRIVNATLLLAIVSYNLSYLFVSDLYALIMIATAVHSLQYHAICWRRNHERFGRDASDPGEPRERSAVLAFLARKDRVWGYAAFTIVFGAAFANTEMLWLGFIPFVLVLHHFYMDGYIWRSALNPTLARDLGMTRPKAAQAGAA